MKLLELEYTPLKVALYEKPYHLPYLIPLPYPGNLSLTIRACLQNIINKNLGLLDYSWPV